VKRILLALLLLLGVTALAPATQTSAAVTDCPPATRTVTGSQTAAVYADNTDGTWDLTGAVWDENAPAPITYPTRSDHWTRGCILGGTVNGNVPKDWTRDQWYNGEDGGTRMGGEVFRQTLTDTPGNYLHIVDAYAEDYEDAYDPNGVRADSLLHLDHVQAKYIRDDCLENEGSGSPEKPLSVLITDSLFDGCFTAFAERPSGSSTAQNGTGAQTFTVEDSLVYLQPQPLGPNYCSTTGVSRGRCLATGTPNVWLGNYGIWKWSNQAAATVTVRNTIFRLDVASYSSCSSQKWPAGTYENVTVVWTGAGPYSTAGECTNVLPAGVTLTTDVSVWDDAKAAWLAGGTAPSPTPEPSPSPEPSSSPSPSPTPEPTPTVEPSPTPTLSPEPSPSPSPTPEAATSLDCPVTTNPVVGQTVVCTYH